MPALARPCPGQNTSVIQSPYVVSSSARASSHRLMRSPTLLPAGCQEMTTTPTSRLEIHSSRSIRAMPACLAPATRPCILNSKEWIRKTIRTSTSWPSWPTWRRIRGSTRRSHPAAHKSPHAPAPGNRHHTGPCSSQCLGMPGLPRLPNVHRHADAADLSTPVDQARYHA